MLDCLILRDASGAIRVRRKIYLTYEGFFDIISRTFLKRSPKYNFEGCFLRKRINMKRECYD
jgi:hypothetical protein